MAVNIYNPYSDEPKVFPNHGAAINTFLNFKELATSERSKNMMTRDEFTEKRIKKLEKNLLKGKMENRVKEITNEMHEVLNRKTISLDMKPYDLKDLSYVIKKNLELVCEAMKKNVGNEGSTSNVPQSTPSTTMTSMMPSSIIDPPLYASVPSPMTPQMNLSEEIPPMGTLIQMNNSQNYSSDIQESPSLIELLNWNNDDVVTLLDDISLNNINEQDPNPTNII
ncbi:agamous-like MADS-box protein AGL80 [Solanum stenotomum]|uniref:agamous-like MADS-box protein AGL80 n=1 Tax=Solanum stenotomum TaxID=172797 RepID=UPI0020D0CC1A|nr:agamous-like MADS-box protein AGL80 [Solanum stenotomum]